MRVTPRQYVQLLVRQLPPGLPMTARAVAHAIAAYADFDTGDNAYPSQSTIARATGLSRRSAIDQVNALVLAGWLQRTRPSADAARRHQTTRYALSVPDEVVRAVAPDLVRDAALGSATRRTRTSERDDTQLVRGVAPNQVIDRRAHTRERARTPKRHLPWCGDCDETTRQMLDPEDGAPSGNLCPRCHWRAVDEEHA